ncbi:hypothetical protein [Campylobacter sp. JMF_03 NE3]|uniref:hypothetical protein n=1 Tax=Campylobacter sp. JMF_03 NE3 TaxID=2983831 RepID=UPI0022E9DD3A|nr:hypothetical protein [Campylobacter sp. JMF_03 NE3]MDA3053570.1 hypothetical protein [Campylobacter sp. JMF_03 NE3]
MANIADFSLKAKGSKESLLKLKEILKCDAQDKPHLFIYECDYSELENDFLIAYGTCKWAVECCFLKDRNTYYDSLHNEVPSLCNIQDLAKELNLEVEIFGNEMGCDFAEHYKINSKGEIENDENINNLAESAIEKIATKFNLDEKEIKDFINDDDFDNERTQDILCELYDDDYDDYVFSENCISYPANYAEFTNGVKYGEFTI